MDFWNAVVPSKKARVFVRLMLIACVVNWIICITVSGYVGGSPQEGHLFDSVPSERTTGGFYVLDDKGAEAEVSYLVYRDMQVKQDRYFLSNHGVITEVSYSTFLYVRVHFIASIALLAITLMLIFYFVSRAAIYPPTIKGEDLGSILELTERQAKVWIPSWIAVSFVTIGILFLLLFYMLFFLG